MNEEIKDLMRLPPSSLIQHCIYLQQENQQLKKQKDDVVEYIKHKMSIKENYMIYGDFMNDLLRMLGEKE